MRYRLRTLLILMAGGPPAIAFFWHWSLVLPHWTLVIVVVAIWIDYCRRRQNEA